MTEETRFRLLTESTFLNTLSDSVECMALVSVSLRSLHFLIKHERLFKDFHRRVSVSLRSLHFLISTDSIAKHIISFRLLTESTFLNRWHRSYWRPCETGFRLLTESTFLNPLSWTPHYYWALKWICVANSAIPIPVTGLQEKAHAIPVNSGIVAKLAYLCRR